MFNLIKNTLKENGNLYGDFNYERGDNKSENNSATDQQNDCFWYVASVIVVCAAIVFFT